MAALYDQFVLFGDSLTQQAHSQERGFGFVAQLTNDYIRRLDVVNRGFSGYNTDQALRILPRVIPSTQSAKMRFLTIFFGANDAASSTSPNKQHVPLDRFVRNLKAIINHPSVVAHSPRIILITPPPVNEYPMKIVDEADVGELQRTAERTKSYADAVKRLGPELDIPVLDIWTKMISEAGYQEGDELLPGSQKLPPNEFMTKLFHDGLHFNPVGYVILHKQLMALIRSHWPDQDPDKLPFVLPRWNDSAAWVESE